MSGLEDSFSDEELGKLRREWAGQEYLNELANNYESLETNCPNHPLLEFMEFKVNPETSKKVRRSITFWAVHFFEEYRGKIPQLTSIDKSLRIYNTLVRIESKLSLGRHIKNSILHDYEEMTFLCPEDPVLKLAEVSSTNEIKIKDVEGLRQYAEITAADLRIFQRKEGEYFRIENFYLEEYQKVLQKRLAQVISSNDGKGVSLVYKTKKQ